MPRQGKQDRQRGLQGNGIGSDPGGAGASAAQASSGPPDSTPVEAGLSTQASGPAQRDSASNSQNQHQRSQEDPLTAGVAVTGESPVAAAPPEASAADEAHAWAATVPRISELHPPAGTLHASCGSLGECCSSCSGFLSSAWRLLSGGCLSGPALLPLPPTAAPPSPGAWSDPFGVLSRGAGRSLAVHVHGLDGSVSDPYCRKPLVRAHIVDESTGRWAVLPPQALAQALGRNRLAQQRTAPELRQAHGVLVGRAGSQVSAASGGAGSAVLDAATPRATMPCTSRGWGGTAPGAMEGGTRALGSTFGSFGGTQGGGAGASAAGATAGGWESDAPRAVSFGGAAAPRASGTQQGGVHDHSLGWSGAGSLGGHPRWEQTLLWDLGAAGERRVVAGLDSDLGVESGGQGGGEGVDGGQLGTEGQSGQQQLAKLTGLPWVVRPGMVLLLELVEPSATLPPEAGLPASRRGIVGTKPGTPGAEEAFEQGRPVAWGYLRLIAPDGSPRVDLSCDASARHLDVGSAPVNDADSGNNGVLPDSVLGRHLPVRMHEWIEPTPEEAASHAAEVTSRASEVGRARGQPGLPWVPSPSVFLQYRMARRHELPYHLHVSATAAVPYGSDVVTQRDIDRQRSDPSAMALALASRPGAGHGEDEAGDPYGLEAADPRSAPVTPSRGASGAAGSLADRRPGGLGLRVDTAGDRSPLVTVPPRGPPSWALLPRRFPQGARSLALLRDPGLTLDAMRGVEAPPEPAEETAMEQTVREAAKTRAEAEGRLNDLLGGAMVPVQGLDPDDSGAVRLTTKRAKLRRRGPRQPCLPPDTHRSSLPAGRLGAVCVRFSPCGRLLAVACAGRDARGSSRAQPRGHPGPGGATGVLEPGGLAEVHHVRIYDLLTADVIAAQGDPTDRVEWEDDVSPEEEAGQSTGGAAARSRARAARAADGGRTMPGSTARVSPGRYDGAVLLGHSGLVHDMQWWPGVGAGAAQGAEPARGLGGVLSARTSPWHWLLTASADGTARLWVVPTDSPMDVQLNRAVRAANGRPEAPAPGPRAGEFTKALSGRSPALAAVLTTVPPSLCYSAAFHPANPQAVLLGTGDGHIQVWDTGVPVAGSPNESVQAGGGRLLLGAGAGGVEDDSSDEEEDEGAAGGAKGGTGPRGHWGEAAQEGEEEDEEEKEARRREEEARAERRHQRHVTKAMNCVLQAAERAERSSKAWPLAGQLQGIAVGPEVLRGSGGGGGGRRGKQGGEQAAGGGGGGVEAILERARSRGAERQGAAQGGAMVPSGTGQMGASVGAVGGLLVSPHKSHVNSVVFPPAGRGRRLASADALGCVVLWTVGDRQRARGRAGTKDLGPRAQREAAEELRASALNPSQYVPLSIVRPEGMGESPLVSIAPRPTHPHLALVGQPSFLAVTEVRGRTLRMVRRYPGLSCETARVNAIFSPDGRLLATGSEDGEICVWDADTGAVLEGATHATGGASEVVVGHGRGYPMLGVAWHPTEHLVALAGYGDRAPVLLFAREAGGMGEGKGEGKEEE